jgi:hypothetical protein
MSFDDWSMRIHITDNAGSGKATLARELGEILETDVFGRVARSGLFFCQQEAMADSRGV